MKIMLVSNVNTKRSSLTKRKKKEQKWGRKTHTQVTHTNKNNNNINNRNKLNEIK